MKAIKICVYFEMFFWHRWYVFDNLIFPGRVILGD